MSISCKNDQFILPDDQPYEILEVKEAFYALTPTENLYTHYLAQASPPAQSSCQ